MITKLNIYKESILVPRNLEGRKEKLHQESIKKLGQETINGDLEITKEMLDIPSNLVKIKTINGNLMCSNMGLTELPEWFKNIQYIKEYFACNNNNLISLENCPQKIGSGFYCYHNKLTSLKGCPDSINYSFSCANNNLVSLEDGPKYVGKNYYCEDNKIKLKKPEDCNIVGKFIN